MGDRFVKFSKRFYNDNKKPYMDSSINLAFPELNKQYKVDSQLDNAKLFEDIKQVIKKETYSP